MQTTYKLLNSYSKSIRFMLHQQLLEKHLLIAGLLKSFWPFLTLYYIPASQVPKAFPCLGPIPLLCPDLKLIFPFNTCTTETTFTLTGG